ncbi:flagellar basal body rod protein [Bacillus canaveralius]|uniref:Flagellar basal body rod protein n=1 Tax=Bacillus canaveralius TaxID=1403243 RepID=A0A2N5GGZ6_9BACI|nr:MULTISPECIES: flagellar basal body rod protein [Bacillus]PLR80030.1 flagellar basal body rod protein [Bacillus canaveralius]PLR87084.1 flagellar basal body rod protein [Bacillus sp. V33-4]PLR94940.1 flagellar basal body rod protein [Bacillus canaveralius]RSK50678.1 flagellar basal body rod protein [Bacillus canaveralius]
MKKFGLLLIGGIAALVLISQLGPMIGLAVSLLVLYLVVKQFLKTESTWAKIGWAAIGFMALMASASNVPAILGVAAAYILYVVYKQWNGRKMTFKEEKDPFVNFEKEWSNLKNY